MDIGASKTAAKNSLAIARISWFSARLISEMIEKVIGKTKIPQRSTESRLWRLYLPVVAIRPASLPAVVSSCAISVCTAPSSDARLAAPARLEVGRRFAGG